MHCGKNSSQCVEISRTGCFFWDTIIRESVPDCYADLGYKTVSTNPCGEIPLCPYDSCRLLAINLYSYVVNPFKRMPISTLNFSANMWELKGLWTTLSIWKWRKLKKLFKKLAQIPKMMRLKPLNISLWEKIKVKTSQGRRTGVGTTGEGDMLAALGFRYGTDEATDFSEEVHKTVALAAYRSSVNMAKERGALQFMMLIAKKTILIYFD
jgi:ribonucleoside-diphosphate reductase alpha chain